MDTRFSTHAEAGRAVPSAPRTLPALGKPWLARTCSAAHGSLKTAGPILGRLLLFITLLLSLSGFAQVNNPAPRPTPLPRAEGEQLARSLITNLLSQKPSENSSNAAVVEMRGSGRKRSQSPARFEVLVTATNYVNLYGAPVPGLGRWMSLAIVHADDRPNEYLLSEPAAEGATNRPPKILPATQLNMPFAGSDFWAEDLGLEFLHWPQQRVLLKEMRGSVFCAVLESVNPHPGRGDYSRVVSWIGINHPDEIVLVHADGYDEQNRLLKEFAPKGLKKVNGAWQLESMEMRNVQADSRTVITFKLPDQ